LGVAKCAGNELASRHRVISGPRALDIGSDGFKANAKDDSDFKVGLSFGNQPYALALTPAEPRPARLGTAVPPCRIKRSRPNQLGKEECLMSK
jgi:hypothetical protein